MVNKIELESGEKKDGSMSKEEAKARWKKSIEEFPGTEAEMSLEMQDRLREYKVDKAKAEKDAFDELPEEERQLINLQRQLSEIDYNKETGYGVSSEAQDKKRVIQEKIDALEAEKQKGANI